MIIGVPKEVKDHEFRVSLTPDGARALCAAGHTVWVEPSAGEGSGFPDDAYQKAGARLAASKEQMFREADLIIKVKEPLLSEVPLFHPGQALFTYLHLAALPELTKALVETKVTAIAYETTEGPNRSLPMLTPMSEIAGRMAVQVGAHYLERLSGGRGVLLGGVPGVPPGRVVVLGSGVVGSSATRIAAGMGAAVTVIGTDLEQLRRLDESYQGRIVTLAANQAWIDREVEQADLVIGADLEQLRRLDETYKGRIVTLAANQAWIDREIEQADLVIGAVMVRGAKAPVLVSRAVVSRMKRGAVIVDVAVDQGGCVETTRPTTHSDPVHTVDGVLHYGVANIPGIVPYTSTLALTNATLPYIVRLVSAGVERAIRSDPGLAQGVNVANGRVTCKAVADAHGMRVEPLA